MSFLQGPRFFFWEGIFIPEESHALFYKKNLHPRQSIARRFFYFHLHWTSLRMLFGQPRVILKSYIITPCSRVWLQNLATF